MPTKLFPKQGVRTDSEGKECSPASSDENFDHGTIKDVDLTVVDYLRRGTPAKTISWSVE